MKLAAIAGFAAGTAIVVYTFLRQHSDSEVVISVSYEMDGGQVRADPRPVT